MDINFRWEERVWNFAYVYPYSVPYMYVYQHAAHVLKCRSLQTKNKKTKYDE